ncbi:MAG: bifunctional phosphopantothenoylcysteine decarboxylase/phosphopantothenate--cysteine ligase CoaBC [Ignavibacteriales bacterium]|nr:bifunctional phosphopantothenoylcysteine decarboxylase/phosphopantothenate--cysteine ligase CoaBC [Ignavibacteriales bacterium]MCF8305894.1 bifunctional phosphopantothenoylcysteine decarboxylase/phosphopantothenate--cysteine ligase CoaBC [Ignavibacteriales bacterium]MCF8315615.1 bifunctional phosphopantothenoylcysteine decarboxylase/phosphopantothenate--cysteine ligase CoaBC [Ignavibacteriales bacterium]MCF8437191.1 bifunctional phosphopantothenoylcysteine decarboxylase/phosphopantothenate--c
MIDNFAGKKILLGITGGIAAYKSALLVREFVKRGASVKVVMTPSAIEFITPLTLSALSGNPVIINTFPSGDGQTEFKATWHIELALWADIMIIAPATVNTIAKLRAGICDNALLTLAAALRSPLLIAPAADLDMYSKPQNNENIQYLESIGTYIVQAESGELASGLSGKGRMADIGKITDAAETLLLGYNNDLKGRKILVTAGPTYEDIDPVRFIGNRSSGKMGFAIARAAWLRGAEVSLISGPVNLNIYPEIQITQVRSALQMKTEVEKQFITNDALIMSAAVADYRPVDYKSKKIKKEDGLENIRIEKTADILTNLQKTKKQMVIGFALETDNEKKNALKKLKSKGTDYIVMNSLRNKGAAFENETNVVTVFDEKGVLLETEIESKFSIAHKILDLLKEN